MGKKIILTLLVSALCLTNAYVFADGDASNEDKTDQATTTVSQKQDENTKEDSTKDENTKDTEEDSTKDENTKDTEEDITKEETTNDDKDATESTEEQTPVKEDEKTPEEQVKENEEKSKIAKDELDIKKQQRAEARLEAKEYIKDLRELFKDADVATKKEILSQIAQVKKELKDYSIGVFVKGMVVDFEKYNDVKPIVKDDRTLVPIRAITETLGATVAWDGATSTITITKGDTIIVMTLDSKIATVNGETVELEVAPTTEKDRTLVPIRFVSETFKLQVEWDEDSQTIVIEE